MSEEELAKQKTRLQNQLLAVMADECRVIVSRYCGVYGMSVGTAVFALHSAQLTTLQMMAPELQIQVWREVCEVMNKRLDALTGKPPVPPATQQPPPVNRADETNDTMAAQ